MADLLLLILVPLSPWLDDRPPQSDLRRFPSAEVCVHMIGAIESYKEFLDARVGFVDHLALFELKAESNEAWGAWETLHSVHRNGYSERRDRLKTLLIVIGPEEYYLGRMPSALPIDRMPWRHP